MNNIKALAIIANVFIATNVLAANDWGKYKVESELMKLSHDVTYCIAQKTFDVLEGTEHSFAERFYKQCMVIFSNSKKQYSRKFKINTISKFHYVLKRMKELECSVKA